MEASNVGGVCLSKEGLQRGGLGLVNTAAPASLLEKEEKCQLHLRDLGLPSTQARQQLNSIVPFRNF